MKKIKTITFHSAHNYGSVLQAYALQTFVSELFESCNEACDYQILNFRKPFQKQFYSVLPKLNSAKNILKFAMRIPYYSSYKIKYTKFENFISQYLNVTSEISEVKELQKFSKGTDYFISGSDQIWNVRAQDFDDAYYLDFVEEGKKISYAVSCGPLMIDWSQYDEDKYKKLMSDYDFISVRETKSKEMVETVSGKECVVNVDPTLLLTKDEWKKIQSEANYNDGKYILLYCLEPSNEQLDMASLVSKKLGLPILITRYNNRNDYFNSFVKKYDCGPNDFLSYIDNAALVLTSSFHGTAFSLIYNKPFYCLNGMTDNRISSILEKTGMTSRSIEDKKQVDSVSLEQPDFSSANSFLNIEIEKSELYFANAFGM